MPLLLRFRPPVIDDAVVRLDGGERVRGVDAEVAPEIVRELVDDATAIAVLRELDGGGGLAGLRPRTGLPFLSSAWMLARPSDSPWWRMFESLGEKVPRLSMALLIWRESSAI